MRKTYGAGYPDTLPALLTWSERNASAPAVTDAAATLTWRSLQDRVLRVAGGLRKAGICASLCGCRTAPTIWLLSSLALDLARWPSISIRAFVQLRSAACCAERARLRS